MIQTLNVKWLDPFYLNKKLTFNWLPALIGGIASIAGGLLSRSSTNEVNDQNYNAAMQNIAYQKQFAKHGVRWRAEDARAAGINPLAALGMMPTNFQPVSIGREKEDYSWIGNMGQAVGQLFGTEEKIKKEELRIRRAEADVTERNRNILLNKDRTTVTATSPWLTGQNMGGDGIDGLLNGSAIELKPAEVSPQVGMGGVQAGRNPFYQYVDMHNNMVQLYPTKNMQEMIQDWNPYAFLHIKDLADIKVLDRKARSLAKEDNRSRAAVEWRAYLRSIRPVEKGYSFEYMGMLRFKKVVGKSKNFFYNDKRRVEKAKY